MVKESHFKGLTFQLRTKGRETSGCAKIWGGVNVKHREQQEQRPTGRNDLQYSRNSTARKAEAWWMGESLME